MISDRAWRWGRFTLRAWRSQREAWQLALGLRFDGQDRPVESRLSLDLLVWEFSVYWRRR